MTMNPTVETCLVGELVRVDFIERVIPTQWRTVGRGIVVAVTANRDGDLRLWVEIHDEECQRFTRLGDCAIGDICVFTIDDGDHYRINVIRRKA